MFNIVERFTAFFKLLVGATPAYLLGILIVPIFKNLNPWLFAVTNATIILGGGIYFLNNRRRKYIDNGDEDYIPEWLEMPSYIALFVGTIISTWLIFPKVS